ncbi:endoribonuclease xendoU domain-containing protein [Ditylenchus destructor]|uniref:Endoribonuclease xendoU domain-containing protein n=1 Tax=Ditylenchus destructor TaxID=166010 RepID=A0AAD4QTV9_9BILA|nr:endoribonuclease xendoU domain-containing protein [Ditylenchus destructor]
MPIWVLAKLISGWEHVFLGEYRLDRQEAFDMSLFTVCSLTHVGNEKCKFKIEDNEMFVSSFIQKCDAGRCLDTSYPGHNLSILGCPVIAPDGNLYRLRIVLV